MLYHNELAQAIKSIRQTIRDGSVERVGNVAQGVAWLSANCTPWRLEVRAFGVAVTLAAAP